MRFAIDKPLTGSAYCHCTRCQRRSGTADAGLGQDRAWLAATRLRRGAPARLDAAGGLAKTFCGECGSALFGRDPETGEIVIVRLGVIDGDPGIRPQAHQCVACAAPWEPIADEGLPRFDERIPRT